VIDKWRECVCVGVYKGVRGEVNGGKTWGGWGKSFCIFVFRRVGLTCKVS
jgi:hypothetical protein